MNAAPFQYPFRHFPGVPRKLDATEAAAEALVCFKAIDGDKGLGNACNFFWNFKKLIITVTSGFGTLTLTQYAATDPAPTSDESEMFPPAGRAGGLAWTHHESAGGRFVGVGGGTIESVECFFDELVYLDEYDGGRYALTFAQSGAIHGQGLSPPPAIDGYSFYMASEYPDLAHLLNDHLTLPTSMELHPDTSMYGDGYPDKPTVAISFEFWTYP